MDKSGVGGGLGTNLLNNISKNKNSHNGIDGDKQFYNDNGSLEEVNENKYSNSTKRNPYDKRNPNKSSFNSNNNNNNMNYTNTNNPSKGYRTGQTKNPNGNYGNQNSTFNDGDFQESYTSSNMTNTKNNLGLSQKPPNLKPSSDINQIQKTVSREQETQTTESPHFSEVQTQTDNFQPNQTNKPVYRIVVPTRVENNDSINFDQLPINFINNSGKTYTTMPGNQINQNVKLVVKSPKIQYVTKEELKIMRQNSKNQLNNIPLSPSRNLKKTMDPTEKFLDTPKSTERRSSKNEFSLLNNVRKPVKFDKMDCFKNFT